MNTHDPCVANKLVNRLQKYILFYVDDCKLSHKDTKADDSFIGVLREEYQSILEDGYSIIQLNRGKVQKYLGVILDYYTVVQVKITMLDCIDELLNTFAKSVPRVGGTKSIAAPDIIFNVNKDCKKLNVTQAVEFHHLVAKIIFDTKRARPDTCTAISFIATRVR